MSFRLRYQGDPALAGVAASVVERLARDAGLHEEEARDLAESARCACERASDCASSADLAAAPRGARVAVRVHGGELPGVVCLEADARAPARRRPRKA